MRHLTLALSLVLLLSACASQGGASFGTDGDDASATVEVDGDQATNAALPAPSDSGRLTATAAAMAGDWELAEGTVDGQPIQLVDGADITMMSGVSTISGTSGCNSYSGDLVIDGDTLSVDNVAVTRMACDDPRMAAEGQFLAGLARVTEAAGEVDSLVLSGPGVELRFKPASV